MRSGKSLPNSKTNFEIQELKSVKMSSVRGNILVFLAMIIMLHKSKGERDFEMRKQISKWYKKVIICKFGHKT